MTRPPLTQLIFYLETLNALALRLEQPADETNQLNLSALVADIPPGSSGLPAAR
jgi:hypothetical protein